MRYSEKNRKRKAMAFLVVFAIVLSLAGCQKAPDTSGFLQGDALSSFEALYGVERNEAFQALGLGENDVSQGGVRGYYWNVKEPEKIQGIEFSKTLVCDDSSGTLCGVRYTYLVEDADKVAKLIGSMLDASMELYGEPSTYPGLSNRITSETFSNDLSAAITGGKMGEWREDWSLGEKTLYTLSLLVSDEESYAAQISLVYTVDIQRWSTFPK